MATDAATPTTGPVADVSAVAVPAEVTDRRNEQAKEYGTYVANQQIFVGAALAYDVGHPVPVSNVKAHGYDKNGLVDKV